MAESRTRTSLMTHVIFCFQRTDVHLARILHVSFVLKVCIKFCSCWCDCIVSSDLYLPLMRCKRNLLCNCLVLLTDTCSYLCLFFNFVSLHTANMPRIKHQKHQQTNNNDQKNKTKKQQRQNEKFKETKKNNCRTSRPKCETLSYYPRFLTKFLINSTGS